MLNPFKKKKSNEIIDLVALEKRGLLKSKEKANAAQVSPAAPEQESATGFIGEFAIGSNSTTTNTPSEELPGLKNKIEDFEFKIDSFSDRFYKLIQRIEVLEKKIERLEGRRGAG